MKDFQEVKFGCSYTGGKGASGTYQKIINEIRPHDIFISGFLGHCAIMRYMQRCEMNVGIELDAAVIADWNDRVPNEIELITGDFVEKIEMVLDKQKSGKRIMIYCDPPYRMSSIKSDIAMYKFTMTDRWHEKFLAIVVKIGDTAGIDMIISHYSDAMYEQKLSGWRVVDYYNNTRQGMVHEKMFINYSHVSGKLHDYRYLGNNKDERYNLKHRTAKNLIRKIDRFELRKRQAILYYLRKYIDDMERE